MVAQAPEPGQAAMPPYDRAVLLAVDVGNSAIKVAGFEPAAVEPAWVRRIPSQRDTTSEALFSALVRVLAEEGASAADVEAIAVVSVVPSVTAALDGAARRLWERPMVVVSSANLPLPVRVDHPDRVGSDRLVDAYAAHRLYGGPLVVADVGTAITVDAVGSDGAFLGGAIAPGPELGLRALADATAGLPRVPLTMPPTAIGRDTVAALQAGAAFGWHDLVAGLIARVGAELASHEGVDRRAVRSVLTGGGAGAEWARGLNADVVDEHLTLKGVARFWAEVAGAAVGGPT
jgi:type III pantothenate kinase